MLLINDGVAKDNTIPLLRVFVAELHVRGWRGGRPLRLNELHSQPLEFGERGGIRT